MQFKFQECFVMIYRISANSCRDNYSFSATTIQGRQLFKGGNYCFLEFWKASVASFAHSKMESTRSHTLKVLKIPICIVTFAEKCTYLLTYLLNIFEVEKVYKSANLKCTFQCDKYSRETTIQGRKLLITRTFLVRQVFKGDNYSREETIRGNTVCIFLTGIFSNFVSFPLFSLKLNSKSLSNSFRGIVFGW